MKRITLRLLPILISILIAIGTGASLRSVRADCDECMELEAGWSCPQPDFTVGSCRCKVPSNGCKSSGQGGGGYVCNYVASGGSGCTCPPLELCANQ